jgi:hypothetical protein
VRCYQQVHAGVTQSLNGRAQHGHHHHHYPRKGPLDAFLSSSKRNKSRWKIEIVLVDELSARSNRPNTYDMNISCSKIERDRQYLNSKIT